MKRLTQKQAATLRLVRPLLTDIGKKLTLVTNQIVDACAEHDYEPRRCHLCVLYSELKDIELAFGSLEMNTDSLLLNGPVPKPAKLVCWSCRKPINGEVALQGDFPIHKRCHVSIKANKKYGGGI